MNIEKYKSDFLEKYPKYINSYIEIFKFGDDPDYLAKLVKEGKKTATSSLFKLYELEKSRIPEKGDIGIVLDTMDNVISVIKNKEVIIKTFLMVDEHIANCEGEGGDDVNKLDYWREVHESFFRKEVLNYGTEFSYNDKIVIEFFEVIND